MASIPTRRIQRYRERAILGRHPSHRPAAAISHKRQCLVDAARVPRASPSLGDVTCTPFIHVSLFVQPNVSISNPLLLLT